MQKAEAYLKPLWEHQKEVIARTSPTKAHALFWEPGTGKSRATLEIIKNKWTEHSRRLKVLIITPSVVTFNWKKEFDLYSAVPQKDILVLHGSGAHRQSQLENTAGYFVVICNYETLLMDKVFDLLKSWGPEIIVADESHRIKNSRAQRTKRAIALSATASYRYILSGTPILQNSLDIYPQFEFLDHGATFGKNFFTFKNRYFRDANRELRLKSKHVTWPKWVPVQSRESELNEKIMQSASVVRKQDCLDLPPLIKITCDVDLSKAQAKAYKEMKEEYITFINSTAYTAQLAITKALRLQQIVSGFLMDAEGRVHAFEDTPRARALTELLEDLTPNHKVIVWACWRANHDTIRKLLDDSGIQYRMLLGDMSGPERDQAISDFRSDEKVRVLLGSQGAGGIGINLVEASYCVYYSRNFSLEHDTQSEARNYRGGSEVHEKITRIDLSARATIDQEITKALQSKQEISDRLIMDAALV